MNLFLVQIHCTLICLYINGCLMDTPFLLNDTMAGEWKHLIFSYSTVVLIICPVAIKFPIMV